MTRFARIMAAVFTLLAMAVSTAKPPPTDVGLVSGSFAATPRLACLNVDCR